MRATIYRNNSVEKETKVFSSTANTAPDIIGNLSVWFKADIGLVPDANGNIVTWLDNSGGGNNANTVGTGFVTQGVDANGVFVNINTDISKLTFGQVGIANSTIFILSKPSSLLSDASPLLSSSLDSNINLGELSTNALYDYKSDFNADANMQNTFNVGVSLIPTLQVFETNNTALEQIVYYAKDSNGVDFYETNYEVQNSALPNVDSIGGVNGVKSDHGVYEIIVFSTKLTASQHADIIGYLNSKYGVQL